MLPGQVEAGNMRYSK